MTARAVEFLHAAAGGAQPFFLYVSYKAPHKPATPAARHLGLFAGVPPWRPPNYAEDVDDKPAWVRALRWTRQDAERSDALRIRMLESLQSVDEGVGAIMQTLRDVGVADRTVVFFTSDNGYALGAHRWEAKQCPYEECMHVPLVVRAPGFGTTPRIDARFVLNVDVAPTLVELAGAVVPSTHIVNGRSLVPLLGGTGTSWRSAMLNEHWEEGRPIPDNALVKQGRCSTTRDTTCRTTADCPAGETCHRWKYVEYVDGERELYDLATDPYELANVASDPANATLATSLAAELHALQAE